jgi:hypothetical protein
MTKLSDKKIKQIIDLSIQLSEKNAKEAATLTFMAKPFVQATLPHRDPGNKPEWVRRNGNLALSIQSGYQDNKITGERELIGIPFGTIPRLFLFWLTKECKRFGNKKIELGNSFAEFIKKLGLNYNTGGGCRSDSVRLKDQLNRFLNCIVTICKRLQL